MSGAVKAYVLLPMSLRKLEMCIKLQSYDYYIRCYLVAQISVERSFKTNLKTNL
jgi:hypothetical protein